MKKKTAISSSPGSMETINRRTYVRFEIELTTYQFEDITQPFTLKAERPF